jgi:methionyl-tRNA formyltransferase
VKAAALDRGLRVTTRVRDVLDTPAELGVVVAFGRLIPPDVLDVLAFVNLHLSLLPRWRGAAPVERAILAGDRESGVSIMAVDVGLDTGGVYEEIRTPIDPDEDATTLARRLAAAGTAALVRRLDGGIEGLGIARPQVGDPLYADKITPADRVLDFSRPAVTVYRVVRIGRASTTFRGEPLLVHRASVVGAPGGDTVPGTLVGDVVVTGSGGLRLLEVQAAGRRVQSFAEFANGRRIGDGEVLGVSPDAPGSPG